MPFTEICIYQVKPQKVEEFETLMLEAKSFLEKQEGLLLLRFVKRGYHIDMEQIKEGLPPLKTTRTIYRDINILSIAGIPVTSHKGYGGGLSLLQGFSPDKYYFTQQEQKNIIQALQILKSSNYPDADKSLNKVLNLLKQEIF